MLSMKCVIDVVIFNDLEMVDVSIPCWNFSLQPYNHKLKSDTMTVSVIPLEADPLSSVAIVILLSGYFILSAMLVLR